MGFGNRNPWSGAVLLRHLLWCDCRCVLPSGYMWSRTTVRVLEAYPMFLHCQGFTEDKMYRLLSTIRSDKGKDFGYCAWRKRW